MHLHNTFLIFFCISPKDRKQLEDQEKQLKSNKLKESSRLTSEDLEILELKRKNIISITKLKETKRYVKKIHIPLLKIKINKLENKVKLLSSLSSNNNNNNYNKQNNHKYTNNTNTNNNNNIIIKKNSSYRNNLLKSKPRKITSKSVNVIDKDYDYDYDNYNRNIHKLKTSKSQHDLRQRNNKLINNNYNNNNNKNAKHTYSHTPKINDLYRIKNTKKQKNQYY